MATEYIISIKVTGSDQASGPLGMVGGALGRIGELITAGIIFRGLERLGQLLNDAGRAGWEAATGFESALAKIAGLTDSTQQQTAEMGAGALAMSKDMRQSANQLADAMYFIASSGFAGTQALDVLRATARAASAGLGETKTIADAVTSALNAYKMKASDAARVTDILTAAVVQGKGEPNELAQSIGRVLPIAAAAGVSLEQVTASMATMTRAGLNADEAATSLRGILNSLYAPGKQAKDALLSIGWSVDEVRQSIRERGLNATLAEMMQRTQGNVETLDLIVPNIRALTGVLSTAASQGDAYAKVLAAIENSTGRTDRAFEIASQTWAFQWDRLKNVLLALPVEVGQKVLPGLTGTLDAITNEIDQWATPLADKIAGPLQGIAARLRTAAETGGIEGVIGEIGKMLKEGWDKYALPAINGWAASFWAWVNGQNGVAGAVPGTLGSLLTAIGNFAKTEWDKQVAPALNEWANKAWDWVVNPTNGALVRSTEALNQLADRIAAWVALPETQATLARLGEQMGNALADGLINLANNSPKVAEFVGALLKSLFRAGSSMNLSFKSVGETLSVSLVDGFIEKITGKETGAKFEEALRWMLKWLAPLAMGPMAPVGYLGQGVNQLRQGLGSLSNVTNTNQTIYGGVNVFGANNWQDLLASLVP